MTDPHGAVVVTGASTGIGRACALRMARGGATVFAGVRKLADGEPLVAQGGPRVQPVLLDVTDADNIAAFAEALPDRLGDLPLTGLVNNAGIAVGGLQEYLPRSEWQRQFDVNVHGVIETTRALLPLLLKFKGRVVNISSMGGRVSSPYMAPYHASKFAVEAITDSLRMELRPFGVWAACVEPGAVKTEIWGKGNALIERLRNELPGEALERYDSGLAVMSKFTVDAAQRGVSADAVAEKVEHALLSGRPKTRYLVGRDANTMVFLKWLLPDRVFEAMVAAFMSRA